MMRRGVWLWLFCLWSSAALSSTALSFNTLSTCSSLNINGYVDTSYNYLLRSNLLTSGLYNRVNDITENGFTLQQADVTFSMVPQFGFGTLLNLLLGKDAYSISPYGLNPNVFDSSDIGFTIPQGYLQYTVASYTFYLGELLSLSGIEQYDYGLDTNFSRSILDGYAQPGTHVGIRLTDQFNERTELIFGLNNGWSTVKQSGQLDTAEFAYQYTLPDYFNITIDGYIGWAQKIEPLEGGSSSQRYLFDTYGTWFLNSKWSLSLNYDDGRQNKALLPALYYGRADWQALAMYVNYQWNDRWRASLRGEIYSDVDGYTTGIRQNWREMTLSIMYFILPQFMLRAETRHDISNVNAFLDNNGIQASNHQQSYALEAYYHFNMIG